MVQNNCFNQSTFTLLILVCLCTTSAKLFVYNGTGGIKLDSKDINATNEPINVIWLFDHSIRLEFNDFILNGHNGDFMLVSEHPLLNQEYFKNCNEKSEDEYREALAGSILTEQGLLLSWVSNQTIEALNPKGTFVLYHAEPQAGEFNSTFDIDATNYENYITTTTTATPDPYVPEAGERTYITKVLNCKAPKDFYETLNDFKKLIASLASEYCREQKVEDCLNPTLGDITAEEVNIPGPNEGTYAGLHRCDPTWENSDNCVEVTFAILRTDGKGQHVLPKARLEDMWTKKSSQLNDSGYCPYEPPEVKIDLNTVVWIAFFLGIIISLTGLLGIAWIRNTKAILEYRKSSTGSDVLEKIKRTDERQPQRTTYDPNNPVYAALERNEQLYPASDFLQVEEPLTSGPFKKRSTENPTFQETEVHSYEFDNNGFEHEESSDVLHSPMGNNNEKIIMRSSWDHRGSDTEI